MRIKLGDDPRQRSVLRLYPITRSTNSQQILLVQANIRCLVHIWKLFFFLYISFKRSVVLIQIGMAVDVDLGIIFGTCTRRENNLVEWNETRNANGSQFSFACLGHL